MLAPLLFSLLPCLLIGNILILTSLSAPEGRLPLYSIPSSSATPCSSALRQSLFGIRGGGFFGFGKRSKHSGSGGDDDGSTPKRFPALSEEEIEEKLNVPIFGITDLNGNGVILSDGGNHVFHFFFSRHMAEAASKAVAAANVGAPELKVSTFHLGKCWFRLITNSGSKMFKLQKCGNDSGKETTKPIHFRLVPNMKDLMGARILTGLKPGDIENLKNAVETPNPEKALSIIHKANTQAGGFTAPFDQVPVFAIAQMRVRRKDENGNPSGEAMLPMHLSTKTMTQTWNEFIQHSPQFHDADATLQLVELHNLVKMMQADSDFDFRNVVFITPSYDQDSKTKDQTSDEDDSDDDGGGGDNGMKAPDSHYDEISVESFVSYSDHALAGVQT
ncbi:hypothetical protein HJC23_007968 [Cyclotella cryptica]|uniref:Uncharacterized protein n=1 Tax=Cyclotella cryptica TaxID=29204 RepID=A0ABD3P6N9_9STRA|eukprot:CCRYP_017318-RA/>CCRYP_017318-RA protein AED:0.36 eAED:0.36 QI:193/1/1/1/1/1/3/363/388